MPINWDRENALVGIGDLTLRLECQVSRRKAFHLLEDETGKQITVAKDLSTIIEFLIEHDISNIMIETRGGLNLISVQITNLNRRSER